MTNRIDKIIERYYAGESSLEEEKLLHTYLTSKEVTEKHTYMIPLFKHFESERNSSFDFDLDLSFINDTSIQKSKIRNLWPKLISIAASFIILVAVAFSWFNNTETMYKQKYTLLEDQADQEEALQITLDALGFLGKKFDKGTKSLIHIKDLERTDIFKSNK